MVPSCGEREEPNLAEGGEDACTLNLDLHLSKHNAVVFLLDALCHWL